MPHIVFQCLNLDDGPVGRKSLKKRNFALDQIDQAEINDSTMLSN